MDSPGFAPQIEPGRESAAIGGDIRGRADSMPKLRVWRLARSGGFRRLVGVMSEGVRAHHGKGKTTGQALEQDRDASRQGPQAQGRA